MFRDQLNEFSDNTFYAEYFGSLPDVSTVRNFNIIHLISTPLTILRKLKHFNKPIFYHWIGTDVYRFTKDSFIKKQAKKLLIKSSVVSNLIVGQNLKDKLSNLGISSTVLPLVHLETVSEFPPLPTKFSILIYLPKSHWEFYCGHMMMEVARLFPQIDFHILASGDIPDSPGNMHTHNIVDDVGPFYKNCNALLRMTVHDGLAKMVLEALSYGRNVIWSESFPYCHKANNLNDLERVIKTLLQKPSLNEDGKKFVETNFNSSKICGDYLFMCENILNK